MALSPPIESKSPSESTSVGQPLFLVCVISLVRAETEAKVGAALDSAEPVVVPPLGEFLPGNVPAEFGDYLLLQILGKGSFGIVYVAILRKHLNLPPEAPLPSCSDCLRMVEQQFAIKRFCAEVDDADAISASEKQRVLAFKKDTFVHEQQC